MHREFHRKKKKKDQISNKVLGFESLCSNPIGEGKGVEDRANLGESKRICGKIKGPFLRTFCFFTVSFVLP